MSKTSEILKELKAKKHIDVDLLSAEGSPCNVTEWLSTGCVALDAVMGGGLPIGRVTEMYGENSSGKSLIAAQVAALAQSQGITVGYIDTETAVSQELMKVLGVDIDNLIYVSPDTCEQVFEFCDDMVEAKEKADKDSILLLIWDSVAATSAKQEMEAEAGKSFYGRHAAIISQGFRKFCRVISKKRVCMLVLNQTREKIGMVFGGDDVATFGGKALSFYSSVRVELKLTSSIVVERANKKKRKIGMNTKAIVTKNKVAIPFREATLPIHFGSGIDDAMSAFQYLIDNELMTHKGPTYSLSIGDLAITCTKKEWPGIFDKNYEAIANYMMDYQPDMGVAVVEDE
jgi:recombination protein RecA